jgi:uncharacterized membrane protein YbhN (UPF0104 family)
MPTGLILILGCLALGASIAYWLVPGFQRDVVPLLWALEGRWLLLALAATLAHYFSEVGRWWCYLRTDAAAGRALLRRLFTVFSITAFVTYLLPLKLGVPVRLYLLGAQIGLPLRAASTLLFVDGLLSYGLWVVATLLLFLALPTAPMPGQPYYYGVVVVGAVALVFAAVRHRITVIRQWQVQLDTVKPSALAAAAAVQIADIAGYVLRHAAILWALGWDLSPGQIAFATAAGITAGLLSMLPMGIGAYDVTIVFLLSAFSVPTGVAVLVPLTNRAVNIVVSMVLGVSVSYIAGTSLLKLPRS